jgi:hypothetical protein
MRRERRLPTPAELGRITSPGLVIRKIRLRKQKPPCAEDQQRKEGKR